MKWQYNGIDYEPQFPINSYGFIYVIYFEDGDGNVYSYYGKKSFWKQKTLAPLKGKTRKRRSMVESDWRTYTGSCKETKGLIPISKEILDMANSKRDLTYKEEALLHREEVLFSDANLNANIAGRHYQGNLNVKQGEWIKWYDRYKEEKECINQK